MTSSVRNTREFRVRQNDESERSTGRTFRLVMWGAVVALLLVIALILFTARDLPEMTTPLFIAAGVIVVAAVFVAYGFAVQLGLEKARRTFVFLLTETNLIRKREGWPDVDIELSEIVMLSEGRKGVVVDAVKPQRRIAIPREVEGFLELQSALARHCAPTKQPSGEHLGLVPGMISAIAFLMSGALTLLSSSSVIAKSAATLALLILTGDSVYLGWRARSRPRRLLAWLWLCLVWAVTAWFVCSRILLQVPRG